LTPVEQWQLSVIDEHGDTVVAGDCMRACVASLFELPLLEVPHFVEHENWWQLWAEWLAARNLRLGNAYVSLDEDDPTVLNGWPGDIWWLASVRSPRFKTRCSHCKGTARTDLTYPESGPSIRHDPSIACPYCDGGLSPGLHLVVMFGREIRWDPHPQRELGHLGFVDGWEFRVIDPAKTAVGT
jgi:hypothetical protein